jgi:hypothetical protein
MKPSRRLPSLAAVVERVSTQWFAGILHPHIRWKRGCHLKRRPEGIVCAAYRADDNSIHVHPLFADPAVPAWVLEWLVYHEMLHMVHGSYHSTELVAAESRHPRTREAERWLSKNLFRLAWKRGRG